MKIKPIIKVMQRTIIAASLCLPLIAVESHALPNNEPRMSQIPSDKTWGERMALTIMQQSPEAWKMMHYKLLSSPKWDYTYGLVLMSFQNLYQKTGDETYLKYGKEYVDTLVDTEGNIKNVKGDKFSLDMLNGGKLLFTLYEKYRDERYLKALKKLRTQIEWQPRTKSGGFWHKKIYPYQMWLDGLYMGSTFWAIYAKYFSEPQASYDDIAHQFKLAEEKTYLPETGLLAHAWDESGIQKWADDSGKSPHVWSRALGWYAMALVDTLEVFPEDHKDKAELVAILERLCKVLEKYQHESGLWYQVTDKGERFGNYLETSGTAMFSYAMAKGVRLGYLPKKYNKVAHKAYNGIINGYVQIDELNHELHLTHTVGGTGLGNSPYRSGSFEYYVQEAVRTNDPHGVGAFILASVELEK